MTLPWIAHMRYGPPLLVLTFTDDPPLWGPSPPPPKKERSFPNLEGFEVKVKFGSTSEASNFSDRKYTSSVRSNIPFHSLKVSFLARWKRRSQEKMYARHFEHFGRTAAVTRVTLVPLKSSHKTKKISHKINVWFGKLLYKTCYKKQVKAKLFSPRRK